MHIISLDRLFFYIQRENDKLKPKITRQTIIPENQQVGYILPKRKQAVYKGGRKRLLGMI